MSLTHGTGEDSASNNNSARNEAVLPGEEHVAVCQDGLKSRLRKKFLQEGTEASSQENVFYVQSTGLSVTEDSLEPEPRNTTISCENIFKGQTKRGDPIRTVLTKGVGGIGKTVLTQKFSLDWAEGRTNQDIQLLFLCPFRELIVLRQTYSLVDLLHQVFSESEGILNLEHLRVLFIFDGLDERNSPLDFTQTRVLTDPTEPASVDVLLVNLIRGSLLPSARLWITTRPAAANRIPAECISMVTEMQGFTDAHKEQYFRKRFSDVQQATAVISHIRTSYSLHSMSHIPAVCEIISTVLHKVMETRGMEQLPQTLTQICIHILLVQMDNLKYKDLSENAPPWKRARRAVASVAGLGSQAFEHLQEGQWIFYKFEMSPNLNRAILTNLRSEMFPQIFREELVPAPLSRFPDKAYFFIQCFQEFLAAFYIHFKFQNYRFNLLSRSQPSLIKIIFNRKPKLKHLLRSAVDQILNSPDQNTDLFLCFVLGLSLPANQSLLQGLQTQTGSSSLVNQEIIKYISKKLNECLPLERRKSMFYCLNEMNDQRLLLEEVQRSMGEERLSKNMSPAHWSTLAFLILTSDVEEFNLRNYCPSEDALLNLLVVVKSYNRVILSHCNLSKKSCGPLSSVLCSSTLRHLDLSNNNLHDSGVKKLCSGLKSAPCRLETLILSCCSLSQGSCGPLSSVLCSSGLRHLDLSNNGLQDSGLKLMCSGLKSTPCILEILRLSGCQVSVEGGTALVLALNLNLVHLRELDLRYNHLGPSVQHLTALRDDPQCPLDTLRLDPAGQRWMAPGSSLRKYSCEFSLDPNTLHCKLCLLGHNRRVTYVFDKDLEDQGYPQHQDRFTGWPQVLSSTGLTGRCYWEAEWSGRCGVAIAMSYRGIVRTGSREDCEFGCNDQSWCLRNINGQFSVCHNRRVTPVQSSFDPRGVGVFSGHVGVYLDSESGSLSFYEVQAGKLYHLYTFTSTFTEPLFPGFGLGYGLLYYGDSVSLVRIAPAVDSFKACLKTHSRYFPFNTK